MPVILQVFQQPAWQMGWSLRCICRWVGLDSWHEKFEDVGWAHWALNPFDSDFEFRR